MPEKAGKGKEALKRARARLSLVNAFNAAAAGLQPLDPKQFGYEADALARQDSLRQHLGQPQVIQPTDAEKETLTRPPMTKEEKRFSRGLLGSVARFHRTSRGVCVRSGDPQHQEWAKVKSAEIKLSYAIYLLEKDLEHYRHLYREGVSANRVSGRLKYYQAPVSPLRVPELWLFFPELAAAQDFQQPPKEWQLKKILEPFPELWKSFHAARWATIEEQTAKRKAVKPKATAAPPATLPPKADPAAAAAAGPEKSGAAAAPPLPAQKAAPPAAAAAAAGKAAVPPPLTAKAAGKPAAAPPPSAAGKGAPPPPGAAAATGGKAAAPPAPPAATKASAPAAAAKGGPPPPPAAQPKGSPPPAPPAAAGKGGPPPAPPAAAGAKGAPPPPAPPAAGGKGGPPPAPPTAGGKGGPPPALPAKTKVSAPPAKKLPGPPLKKA